jgi:rhodanese-related sulfurtransferase
VLATGGSPGSGGALTTGGALGSGGSLATGGSIRSGGATATGGALGSAGALATGGVLESGGSLATSGSIRSGGATATGGALGSGGALATGGYAGAGGAAGTGGSKNTADAGRDAATCTGWTTLVHLTPQQLKDLLAAQDVYLVNVASPKAPNIAGTDLDLQTGSDATATVTAIESLVNHNTCADIVVYCVTGNTSQRVATQLISDGYLRVRDLQGGITAWQNQGFPVVQPDGGH